ncbi:MAG: DUF3098 domain-containing protein [Rikenellaceae bacterium]
MNNKNTHKESEQERNMPLAIKNYKLLLAGFIVILLGFILMSGGGGTSATEFDYSMFSWRRVTLAPIVVVIGFILEAYAILKK